uniref:Putative secreted protein n=1 Tax=Lutzomyia longipalpis TaxID=7200 RepID=A0A7G3AN72_LUTLO
MFRGQECRIVILCLLNDGCGHAFLSCGPHCPITLLTRAREGLFIVENVLNVLEKKEKDEDEEEDEDNEEDEKENYWAKVKTVLENKNAIGTGLPIKCEKHGSEIIAKSFGDFMDFTKKGCAVGKDLPQTSNHPCFDVVEDEN